jgi:hypothetical protein
MPPKINPLKLNGLQLKTLTLLQELARDPRTCSRDEASGETLITMIPQLHGNHLHVGRRVAMAKDASGLWNPAVWNALERKGLAVGNYPIAIRLTADGVGYETGLRDKILYGSDH